MSEKMIEGGDARTFAVFRRTLHFRRRGDSVREYLQGLGITRSRGSDMPVAILAALFLVVVLVFLVGWLTRSLSVESRVALAAALVTVAGLLVAVLQWRNGLGEKAFDALYHRIALANDMRLRVAEGLDTDDEAEIAVRRPIRYRFFVYTEIDSLEYAVRRYRFGLGLNAEIVARAVRHFRSRCENETFRDTAEECVGKGAYFPDTKKAVVSILTQARSSGSGTGHALDL